MWGPRGLGVPQKQGCGGGYLPVLTSVIRHFQKASIYLRCAQFLIETNLWAWWVWENILHKCICIKLANSSLISISRPLWDKTMRTPWTINLFLYIVWHWRIRLTWQNALKTLLQFKVLLAENGHFIFFIETIPRANLSSSLMMECIRTTSVRALSICSVMKKNIFKTLSNKWNLND